MVVKDYKTVRLSLLLTEILCLTLKAKKLNKATPENKKFFIGKKFGYKILDMLAKSHSKYAKGIF